MRPQMRTLLAALPALFLAAAAMAQDAPPPFGPPDATPLTARLPGNTVSGVMFLPSEGKTKEQLDRVVFQAFLEPGGSALMRRWDGARDAYTAPANGSWHISGDTLCLAFPDLPGPEICVVAHTWGPRIAGNGPGSGRFALLDGKIEPGNSFVAER
jgi:hypothetical protein